MSYSCVYESTLFYNPADKHSVIRVRTRDNTVPDKARKAANGRDDFIRFIAKGYNLHDFRGRMADRQIRHAVKR